MRADKVKKKKEKPNTPSLPSNPVVAFQKQTKYFWEPACENKTSSIFPYHCSEVPLWD